MPELIRVRNDIGNAATEFGASQLSDLHDPDIGAISITIDPRLGAETFEIRPGDTSALIVGGDSRGAMYGALEAAEQIAICGSIAAAPRRPYLAVRGLKFFPESAQNLGPRARPRGDRLRAAGLRPRMAR